MSSDLTTRVLMIEEQLAWMSSDDLARCDDELRRFADLIPDLSTEEVPSLLGSLERLRRALMFAHEVWGKRLEAVSPREMVYTPAGAGQELEHHF